MISKIQIMQIMNEVMLDFANKSTFLSDCRVGEHIWQPTPDLYIEIQDYYHIMAVISKISLLLRNNMSKVLKMLSFICTARQLRPISAPKESRRRDPAVQGRLGYKHRTGNDHSKALASRRQRDGPETGQRATRRQLQRHAVDDQLPRLHYRDRRL